MHVTDRLSTLPNRSADSLIPRVRLLLCHSSGSFQKRLTLVSLMPYAIMFLLPIIVAVVSVIGKCVHKAVVPVTKSLRYAEPVVDSEGADPSPDSKRGPNSLEPKSLDAPASVHRSISSSFHAICSDVNPWGKQRSTTRRSSLDLEVFDPDTDNSWRAKAFAFLQGLRTTRTVAVVMTGYSLTRHWLVPPCTR